jgi:acetate kinase
MQIVSFNCGSSSLKFAAFDVSPGREQPLGGWQLDDVADHTAALARAIERLEAMGLGAPDAVGHRLVHGGPLHFAPARVDDAVMRELRSAVPFAPLHLPAALDVVEGVRARWPRTPAVVCFDTGFHAHLPAATRRLPIPRDLADRGLWRYGFHGLSYEFVMSALGAEANAGRLIIAHLGSGASLVAIFEGRPLDTTMGLTPAGGVIMGTRTGDLDPGVLLYLMREGQDAAALDALVNHEGGLLAISETTPDMKTLLAHRATDPRADLAVSMFCLSVRKAVGALAAVLGGLDRLVFTGGIGEHAPEVRAEILGGLQHLGPFDVRVIPTDEDRVIARHTFATLAATAVLPIGGPGPP